MLQGCGTAASVIDGSSVEAHMNIMKTRSQTLLTHALSCLAHVSISLSLSLSGLWTRRRPESVLLRSHRGAGPCEEQTQPNVLNHACRPLRPSSRGRERVVAIGEDGRDDLDRQLCLQLRGCRLDVRGDHRQLGAQVTPLLDVQIEQLHLELDPAGSVGNRAQCWRCRAVRACLVPRPWRTL